MAKPTVILDACVLYRAPLRDLLLWLAVTGLYRPRWTETIHQEWVENLLDARPELARARLERTRDLMNQAVQSSEGCRRVSDNSYAVVIASNGCWTYCPLSTSLTRGRFRVSVLDHEVEVMMPSRDEYNVLQCKGEKNGEARHHEFPGRPRRLPP